MITIQQKASVLWYLIFLIYCVYYMQDVLYASGGVVSQSLVLSVILIGLYNLVVTVFEFKRLPAIIFWTFIFFLILSVTFVISPKLLYASILNRVVPTLTQYKESSVFCLSLFTGYQIGKRLELPIKQYRVSAIILLCLAIFFFLKTALNKTGEITSNSTTNNSAYLFLYIVPFVAIIYPRHKGLSALIGAVIFAFVLSGAKRGAILCMILMLLFSLIWYNRYFKLRLVSVIGIVMLFMLGAGYMLYTFNENKYLQQRLESTMAGNSSNRDNLYEKLWDKWSNDDDPVSYTFGRGTAQTLRIVGNYAHNDWLELLIDNGILGVTVYLMMFVSAFHFIRKNKRWTDKYTYLSMMLWLIFWFAKSIFSMGYVSLFGGISMMLFGVQIGNITSHRIAMKRASRQRKIFR